MQNIDISVLEVQRKLAQGAITLIDCREQNEWETARIEGAILMPMSELASFENQLNELRNSELVIHCHHGGRSQRVARWLLQNGFTQVQNMAGGIDAAT